MYRESLRIRNLRKKVGTIPTPALSLDFLAMATGGLDPRITVTRAGTATRINSAGLIEVVAENLPRWDYDPFTLELKGLLIEPARTNILIGADIGGADLLTQVRTVTNTAMYSLSFYGTGTITLSGADTGVVVGTGAYPNRRTYTFTATSASLTLTVTGTVQYAMLHLTNAAFNNRSTSFIPTILASVARANDIVQMTGTNFSDWYNQNEGSFYGEHSVVEPQTDGTLLSANDGTQNEQIDYRISNTGQGQRVRDGAVQQSSYTLLPVALPSVVHKVAGSYKLNFNNSALNGASGTPTTFCTVPTPNRLDIGSRAAASVFFGHVRNIKYYSTALNSAQLRSITR